MTLAARNSVNGALHFVCMDWRHVREILAAGEAAYGGEPKKLIVWAKTNSGMGSLYRSGHELIFLFKVGDDPHVNNVQLGRFGRHRSNLWTYLGVNSFGKGRNAALEMHPTVKPVCLVADAIRDCSSRSSIILDTFGGSGTTLIAAEQTERRARLIELDPRYVDVAIRRWERITGGTAIEERSAETFAALAEARDGARTDNDGKDTNRKHNAGGLHDQD